MTRQYFSSELIDTFSVQFISDLEQSLRVFFFVFFSLIFVFFFNRCNANISKSNATKNISWSNSNKKLNKQQVKESKAREKKSLQLLYKNVSASWFVTKISNVEPCESSLSSVQLHTLNFFFCCFFSRLFPFFSIRQLRTFKVDLKCSVTCAKIHFFIIFCCFSQMPLILFCFFSCVLCIEEPYVTFLLA